MKINLAGVWNIRLDQKSLAEGRQREGKLILPGILQAQGYGNPITRETPWVSGLHDPFWYKREEYQYGQENGCKVPFLSQPPAHYIGKAWYEREIEIPIDLSESLYLRIELTRWKSQVWVDDCYMGSDCSLCTAHEIKLGQLSSGQHKLTVCIDNSFQYPYRPDGHGVSDALGATWNGMAGEISLITQSEKKKEEQEKKDYATAHPRYIKVKEGQFFVDGRPEYFRGTHFGGDYPLTGYPTTDYIWWKNLMETIKTWGFNFIRCHSYCPPDAAFLAADEVGIYLLPECGMWNVFHEDIPMLSVLREETRRILHQFGHHPSFVLFSPTNEPDGAWYQPLKQWVEETREYDERLGYKNRRLYTAQSGWFYDTEPRKITGIDYIYFHRSGYGPILGGNIRNYEGWKGKDYGVSLDGVIHPVICHEMGQWCAYPDYSVMDKFTGYLQPGNYHVFAENAKAHGVLNKSREFCICSGKTQLMMYKEEIEANLRTPHLYGFEMLDLHDYLGQGTALVGILDAFWENKGYGSPEEFRKFCGATVLLARIPSYVYKNTDCASISLELCHYGKRPMENQIVLWDLREGAKILQKGEFVMPFICCGKNIPIGMVNLSFLEVKGSKKLTFQLQLGDLENSWDLYIYEKKIAIQEKFEPVLYTRDWKTALKALEQGERVVYSPRLSSLDYSCPPLSIRPIFWNAQMGPSWGRNLGMVVKDNHPIFRCFPTEDYGGWQWEDILEQARGFHLNYMPEGLEPIVTMIDDWNRNLPLGLLFEGKMGKGKLLVVSACLEGSFEERPGAWSLKQAILDYVSSEEFQPKAVLKPEMITNHLFPNGRMRALETVYRFDVTETVYHPEALTDDNPNTSVWIEKKEFPISVDIQVKKEVSISGIVYMPDQKDRLHRGNIKEYEIWIFLRSAWIKVCSGEFASSFLPQQVLFNREYQAKRICLVIRSSHDEWEGKVWEPSFDGWYKKKEEEKATAQIAALHLLCDEVVTEDDVTYWNRNRKSRTREIEN